jgi:hypothetical protein
MQSPLIAKLSLLAVGLLGLAAAVTYARAALPTVSEVISRLDQDHDGTLSWDEVKVGALAEFQKLDTDQDGTVDAKEWANGQLPQSEWKNTHPGKDGKLTQDGYLTWLKKKFKAADPDHDGTVDTKELSSSRAAVLLKVLE